MTTGRTAENSESLGAIFTRFLKFGCLAWGGPAAQIAMIKRECVDEEQWISDTHFKRLLAVYQVLPGPEAHELCVYFGRHRGGKLGGFLTGLGFMLPGFILMLGLSALYVEANLAGHLHALFYGLTAAVGALVARALVRLGGSFITDVPLALIAIVGFALTIFAGASFILVLLGGGLAYELWRGARRLVHAQPARCRPDRGRDDHDLAHRRNLLRGPEGRAPHLRRRLYRRSFSARQRRRRPPLADE